jgi:hypothetical protein
MRFNIDCCGYILAVLLFTVLTAWGGVYDAKSNPNDVQVAGIWAAHFLGTVEGKGTPHDDTFVMELKQEGSKVTGTLRFEGLDLDLPVSGNVSGTAFSYSSKARLSPNCEATIAGATTVEPSSGKFKGSQTQTTCEGTAVGQVTAVRR